ncbi:MAG: trypsin-like peptidase domain-containing protein [Candidatus Hydrogenedentes bacterium]|nr:trypsin-like peptidase domain-containing protein [Candidatus Hydrogenedentota bacterium]
MSRRLLNGSHKTGSPILLAGRHPAGVLATLLFCGSLAAQSIPLRQINEQVVKLVEQTSPSVVLVMSNAYGPLSSEDGGGAVVSLQQSAGSGVILTEDGYIVTNRHVVAGATRIQVRLPSREKAGSSILRPRGKIVPARVIGSDEETDLALLKVDENQLPFLKLGDSEGIRQGQMVFALGNPLGLEDSLSMGVVSAVARQLRPDDRVIYIQTDAAINPGNSGGPLIDTEGQVIGINTFILSQSRGSEGLGFAVPSNIVHYVFDELKQHGSVSRGDIGIEAQTLTPGMAAGLGLPVEKGVIVADVTPKGPADVAEVKSGDIILAMDGKPMENARQFHVNVYLHHFGSVMTLDMLREGKKVQAKVVALERDDNPDRFAAMVSEQLNLVQRLGVLAMQLEEKVLARLPPLRKSYGILVARRSLTAMGSMTDLKTGDIISAVNNQPVSTLKELRDMLNERKPGENAVLQIQRDGKLRYVEVTLE